MKLCSTYTPTQLYAVLAQLPSLTLTSVRAKKHQYMWVFKVLKFSFSNLSTLGITLF